MSKPGNVKPCGLPRRLGCMLYDLFAVVAILMAVAMLVVALRGGTPVAGGDPAFRVLLLVAHWLYFAYCWRFGGQTLGMRAWRVHLTASQTPVTWSTTVRRYAAAWLSLLAAGAGFWSALAHPARLAWHDRLSGSWLEYRP